MYKRFSIIMLAVALSSCGTPQQKASALEENKEAKSLLEGIWLDDNTETALLRVKGDTLFYADAATAPVAFKIIGDSLITYGARTNGYKIEKQGEHIFWFHSAVGDVIRLHKSDFMPKISPSRCSRGWFRMISCNGLYCRIWILWVSIRKGIIIRPRCAYLTARLVIWSISLPARMEDLHSSW